MHSILVPVPLFHCSLAGLKELIVHMDQVLHQTVHAPSWAIRPRYNQFQRLLIRKCSVNVVTRNLYSAYAEEKLMTVFTFYTM